MLVYAGLPAVIRWMNIPAEAVQDISGYLSVVLAGLVFMFLYHFTAAALRSVGNSAVPLFSVRLDHFEYRTGSAVCGIFFQGMLWGGIGDRPCAGSSGAWNLFL